jgi:hypothetical protein
MENKRRWTNRPRGFPSHGADVQEGILIGFTYDLYLFTITSHCQTSFASMIPSHHCTSTQKKPPITTYQHLSTILFWPFPAWNPPIFTVPLRSRHDRRHQIHLLQQLLQRRDVAARQGRCQGFVLGEGLWSPDAPVRSVANWEIEIVHDGNNHEQSQFLSQFATLLNDCSTKMRM